MTALWFKPRDIGFAEGLYAGWGNFGSAAAAMTLPTIALTIYGGTTAGAGRSRPRGS
jgi:MFS transporter, NNP family, nitrate/nitrite transporter